MLQVTVPGREFWDEENEEFGYAKPVSFQLEHSLVSLSKWESKWCKPFLGDKNRTDEETFDYIRCMTVSQNIEPEVYKTLPDEVYDQIQEYINAPMTATWFNERDQKKGGRKEVITSEVIYYWMIAQSIPMECQKWHLNRLLTLIRVCSLKNNPPKKPGRRESVASRKALNEARRAQMNSKG